MHDRQLKTTTRWADGKRLGRLVCVLTGILPGPILHGEDHIPASRAAPGGVVIYVSKLGDNSDGTTWAKAYTTVQAALNAVPDDKGGHRILVRPDTYVEANLYPAHQGAPGAYNLLMGDYDGSLESGATGWVVIDSGCPDKVVRTSPKGTGGNPGFIVLDSGGPEKGLKSIDWWAPWRCDPDYSGVVWDRWTFRHLYATGSEAGMGWDMTCKPGAEFSAIVENCVGIGRFAGACVIGHVARAGEPVLFRRSYFCCMDWWGDAGAAYVRAHHTTMPDYPDAVFEDCTLVSPDNALECGFPGFTGYTRVRFKNCRLIAMNFSQPAGTPSSGIIHTPLDGSQLHVDIENSTLLGYKVFGAGQGEISYTTKGAVQAYVQFLQPTPAGFERLGLWPTEIFQCIAPPKQPQGRLALVKEDRWIAGVCEAAPIVWKDRLVLMECIRPAEGGKNEDYFVVLRDVAGGEEIARLAQGYGLACAIVHDGAIHVFASRHGTDNTWNDVTCFTSSDLKQWEQSVAVRQEKEHLFNTSVCATPDGFVMAYETDDPQFPAFTIKFARSKDLRVWEKVPEAIFGKDRYTACPCIRYSNGHFYLMYLERRTPRWFFETWLARSKDLNDWEMSPGNPVLTPGINEDVNTSDPDIIEYRGTTFLYYSIGDQRTWTKLKRATYPGTLKDFFEECFEAR